MKELLKNKDIRTAVIHTGTNIAKTGVLAAASIFTTNLFRTQTKGTIEMAHMDISSISALMGKK